jgi:small subunit ribosomal protein S15
MALNKAKKTDVIKAFQTFEGDTGSPEVQVALLTNSILELTEHLKKNKKITTRGLLKQVSKRGLGFLMKHSAQGHKVLLEKLGLNKICSF